MCYVHSSDGATAANEVHYELPDEVKDLPKAERMALGWYDGVISAPEPQEGKDFVMSGWTRVGDDFHAVFREIEVTIPHDVIRYSVRSIIRELRAAGKYDAVRQLLESARLDWDFVGANYLSTADADFQAMCEAIISAEIANEAELDALLAKCIWEEA